jgi:hypothetical protein
MCTRTETQTFIGFIRARNYAKPGTERYQPGNVGRALPIKALRTTYGRFDPEFYDPILNQAALANNCVKPSLPATSLNTTTSSRRSEHGLGN